MSKKSVIDFHNLSNRINKLEEISNLIYDYRYEHFQSLNVDDVETLENMEESLSKMIGVMEWNATKLAKEFIS